MLWHGSKHHNDESVGDGDNAPVNRLLSDPNVKDDWPRSSVLLGGHNCFPLRGSVGAVVGGVQGLSVVVGGHEQGPDHGLSGERGIEGRAVSKDEGEG